MTPSYVNHDIFDYARRLLVYGPSYALHGLVPAVFGYPTCRCLTPQQQGYHKRCCCRDHETFHFHEKAKYIYLVLQTFFIKSQSGIVQRLGYSAFNTFWVEAPERPGFGKIHHSTSIRNIVLTTYQIPGTGNITSHDAFFFLLNFWLPHYHHIRYFSRTCCVSVFIHALSRVRLFFFFANTSVSRITKDTRCDNQVLQTLGRGKW
jgi:hypothetical protein